MPLDKIQGNISAAKKRVDFQAFLDNTIAEKAKEREIYIVFG
jgi:hypothetical protein